MADAGSIFYASMADAGQSIGNAIAQFQKRHQKVQEAQSQIDLMSQTPDPSQPGKMLLDQKRREAMTNYLARHGQYAAGAIDSMLKMQQLLAMTGAKARVKSEQQDVHPWMQGGRAIGYFKNGIPHPFPKYAIDQLAGVDPEKAKASKHLDKLLSSYGLERGDLDAIDTNSLTLLDSKGKELQPDLTVGEDVKPLKRIGGQTGPIDPNKEMPTPVKQTGQGSYVAGQAGDKSFKIPINKFREIMLHHKAASGDETGESESETGQTLDADTARKILQEAGGDRNKARQIARARGYSF